MSGEIITILGVGISLAGLLLTATRGLRLWKRIVFVPLCTCMLAAGSVHAAENQALTVGASETDRLRDLLSDKRIEALFMDGTHLRGQVKEVQDGLLAVDIKKSTGPNPVLHGLQDLPTDRISTVQFTRYKGGKRFLYGALFFLGGLGLGAVVQTKVNESSVTMGSALSAVGACGGMTVLGYLWGTNKDKQNVTLTIQR